MAPWPGGVQELHSLKEMIRSMIAFVIQTLYFAGEISISDAAHFFVNPGTTAVGG